MASHNYTIGFLTELLTSILLIGPTPTIKLKRVVGISLWSCLIGPSFMSISSLVLELWHFSFIRGWPEIRKLEIHPPEFCPISRDWGKLGIPNLVQISLIKFYWKLQNARGTAFTVFELLTENKQGIKLPTPHTQISVKNHSA